MIEPVDKHNIDEVLPLIRLYQEFYNCRNIDEARNREHFRQFGLTSEMGCQFLYRLDGSPVAFATIYFTFSSTLPGKVGLMNDLFTSEACRGKGIGKQLIAHCLDYAKSQGALRIQWFTAPDNLRAQRLYDSLPANKSEWLYYTYAE